MTNIEIPTFDELSFDEVKHIYRLDGQYIPSVSTVMRPLSQALYKDVDEDVLNKAAARGTAVHNAIENFVKFGIVDIDPQWDGYFRAFRSWWKETNPTCLATECRVYHKVLRYAGTADMPVVVGNERILIDFKTSASVNKAYSLKRMPKRMKATDFRSMAKQYYTLKAMGIMGGIFIRRTTWRTGKFSEH